MSDFFWFSDAQWARIAPLLPTDTRGMAGGEDAPDRLFIDATCNQGSSLCRRRKRGALAHGIGRTKGGRNTKLHAVCDAKGRPLVLLLTPGNVHDCKVAQRCIEAMPPAGELVADKGYDSKALRDWLAERGTTAVIPPRENRKVQYHYDKTVSGSATSSSACFAASRTGAV